MAALTGEYDAVVFDCDGVLYLGDKLIDGALATLRALRDQHGLRVFFVTNNSRIDAAGFARKFEAFGLGEFADAENGSMWTSTSATAHYFAARPERERPRAALVLGDECLKAAVAGAGVEVINAGARDPAEREATPNAMARAAPRRDVGAVVVGFDQGFCYHDLALAVLCLTENRRRADDPPDAPPCEFIVTNRDFQYPVRLASGARRVLPGNGTLVSAIATGARREPTAVTGKPSPTSLHAIVARHGLDARRVLMVGDMWSDVEFAHAGGARAALVLTGVATEREAQAWRGSRRPDVVPASVTGLVDARSVRPFSRHGGAVLAAVRWLAWTLRLLEKVLGIATTLTSFGAGALFGLAIGLIAGRHGSDRTQTIPAMAKE